jgi:voltage-gated potassium channel
VFKAKKEELILTSVLMCFILIISSCFVYYFESPVQPEAFPDIPATLWWAIVTLTTIGYGDVFPITIPGKFITSLIAILGIGMFALPAGILGAGFVETIQKKQAAKKRCPHCGQLLEGTLPEAQTPYEKDIP